MNSSTTRTARRPAPVDWALLDMCRTQLDAIVLCIQLSPINVQQQERAAPWVRSA